MGAQVQKKQKRLVKTYSQKPVEVTRSWYLFDASEVTLGRMSSKIAELLSGKGKVTYTPHVDGGDNIVVINAAKLKVSGAKMDDKMYYNYSGYISGLRERTLAEVIETKPEEAIERAVFGMLPKNKLRPEMMKRLRVFADDKHGHEGQKPVKVELIKKRK